VATSDDVLIAQAIDGDGDALSVLLKRHGSRVRSRLAGKISKRWRSVLTEGDVMQVTYLEAFLDIGQLKRSGAVSFLAWLTKIAEHNMLNAIKALEAEKRPNPRKRVRAPQGEDSFVVLLNLVVGTGTTPSRGAARQENQTALEAAIARLPESYQQVVRLYDLEGRSVAEVAQKLDRSVGAIYMLRTRAHEHLRDLLGPVSNYFTDTA